MKKRITVETAVISASKLIFSADESIENLHPGGQVLVDTDQVAFIYLMEGQDDYTYIAIPERLWPIVKTAMDKALSVWITYRDGQMELVDFQGELEYVIDNIKGNSNYGKEMVAKVEEVFQG
ncbi:hypothetical protein [Bacillus sp. FJAT-29814]|uniref:UPF0738 family protein n=1 Tax=Bacillus sp. FJAT-29814 TaxID=1729688 RepID=UPI00082C5E1B|nr:hypothetical protein [Bacillus sp. FJAT-29814]